jgi:hypothetical protein
MDCLVKMIVFSVLTVVVTLAYVSLVISCQDKGRPSFLEDIFDLTQM